MTCFRVRWNNSASGSGESLLFAIIVLQDVRSSGSGSSVLRWSKWHCFRYSSKRGLPAATEVLFGLGLPESSSEVEWLLFDDDSSETLRCGADLLRGRLLCSEADILSWSLSRLFSVRGLMASMPQKGTLSGPDSAKSWAFARFVLGASEAEQSLAISASSSLRDLLRLTL